VERLHKLGCQETEGQAVVDTQERHPQAVEHHG